MPGISDIQKVIHQVKKEKSGYIDLIAICNDTIQRLENYEKERKKRASKKKADKQAQETEKEIV